MLGLSVALRLVEKGWAPDFICRIGIRSLLSERLRHEDQGSEAANLEQTRAFAEGLKQSPIAIHTDDANAQHYELPPEFFKAVLGEHLKYSGCFWSPSVETLDQAEEAMLQLTCDRAEISDGMEILELGCGWGSLSLWMAERYPNSRILAMSNSKPQRHFIMERAAERGLNNLEVVTADINTFRTDRQFDRVVSVEMFEHVRNYDRLLKRISSWLRVDGRLFVHIFSHVRFAYPYETEGAGNWMGRYFFTGGIMPSDDLFSHFNDDMEIEAHWQVDGTHYSRTARAWLDNLDAARQETDPILAAVYGRDQLVKWRVRWRLFFMACEELFGFRNGSEWIVSHYRFKKRSPAPGEQSSH